MGLEQHGVDLVSFPEEMKEELRQEEMKREVKRKQMKLVMEEQKVVMRMKLLLSEPDQDPSNGSKVTTPKFQAVASGEQGMYKDGEEASIGLSILNRNIKELIIASARAKKVPKAFPQVVEEKEKKEEEEKEQEDEEEKDEKCEREYQEEEKTDRLDHHKGANGRDGCGEDH